MNVKRPLKKRRTDCFERLCAQEAVPNVKTKVRYSLPRHYKRKEYRNQEEKQEQSVFHQHKVSYHKAAN
jgi:hypothetical protein